MTDDWNPQLRQHHYYCTPCEASVVLQARIGESPETPTCRGCGVEMKKDWGAVTIRYSRSWYNANPLKKRGKAANRP